MIFDVIQWINIILNNSLVFKKDKCDFSIIV